MYPQGFWENEIVKTNKATKTKQLKIICTHPFVLDSSNKARELSSPASLLPLLLTPFFDFFPLSPLPDPFHCCLNTLRSLPAQTKFLHGSLSLSPSAMAAPLSPFLCSAMFIKTFLKLLSWSFYFHSLTAIWLLFPLLNWKGSCQSH